MKDAFTAIQPKLPYTESDLSKVYVRMTETPLAGEEGNFDARHHGCIAFSDATDSV
jgi:hypothetical protein